MADDIKLNTVTVIKKDWHKQMSTWGGILAGVIMVAAPVMWPAYAPIILKIIGGMAAAGLVAIPEYKKE